MALICTFELVSYVHLVYEICEQFSQDPRIFGLPVFYSQHHIASKHNS